MNKIKILFFLTLISLSSYSQTRSCRDVLATAESFLLDGNVENTRKILNQTREKCGDDLAWYYLRFVYDETVNQTDSALFFTQKAIQLFPKNDSLYALYAQASLFTYDSAQCEKGLVAIEKAIDIKNKPNYQLSKVQLLHSANKLSEALTCLTTVPKVEKSYDALVEWGSLLSELNKPKDALKKLNTAIRLNPYNPSAYLQKADLFFTKLNKQDQALAALDTVEMIDSTLADPMLMRAAFFESRNDFDNAIAEYDMAIQTDSSVHQVYIFRGNCLKEIKEYALAEEDYNQYKKQNPNDNEINYMLADLYIAKGDYNAAAMLMSQMETKGESEYDMYLMRGMAYASNGQYDNALTDFNKAENFKEKDVRLFYNRGLCYFNKQEYRKAKYDFERAKNYDPQDMEIQYMHCKAAYHAGYVEEACESCKIAKFHGYEPIDKIYLKACE